MNAKIKTKVLIIAPRIATGIAIFILLVNLGQGCSRPFNDYEDQGSSGQLGLASRSSSSNVVIEGVTKVYYIQTDHLNTPRILTNDKNKIVWSWSPLSEAFGDSLPNENLSTTGEIVKFNLRFPGQYYDGETKIFYNFNRNYSPTLGRYLESDPLGLVAGMNTYAYVGGNPVNSIDPSGLNTGNPEAEFASRYTLMNDIMAAEDAYGTADTSALGLIGMRDYNGDGYTGADTPFIKAALNLDFNVAGIGKVDGDWAFQLAEVAYMLPFSSFYPIGRMYTEMTFLVAKPIWNEICNVRSAFTKNSDGSYAFDIVKLANNLATNPWRSYYDPGNKNAPDAAALLLAGKLTYREIFEEWLKKHKGQKDQYCKKFPNLCPDKLKRDIEDASMLPPSAIISKPGPLPANNYPITPAAPVKTCVKGNYDPTLWGPNKTCQ